MGNIEEFKTITREMANKIFTTFTQKDKLEETIDKNNVCISFRSCGCQIF